MVKDMTSGNPTRLLLSFAIPMLIGNIFQQLYSMVDSIVIGQGIGVEALAAVGATFSLDWAILGFCIGLSEGFAILIAQKFGAGDYNGLKKAFTTSFYLTAIVAVIVTIISQLLSMPILKILNTPADIIDNSNLYISIIFGGIIITMFYNFLSATLRALGDSRTPLIALLIACSINIVLDILFVMKFNMGIAGAAYATLIAQASSCLFCILAIRKIDFLHIAKKDWKFEKEFVKNLLILGLPMALQNSIISIGAMVLQYVVNGYGALYVAAYTAAIKISGIIEQPGATFGFAMATYAGQNLGAVKFDRIRLGLKKCIKLSMGFCIGIMAIIFLFGETFIGLIVSQEEVEVIAIAHKYLHITVSMLCVLNLLFIYRSALQGFGNTVIPMISGGLELAARITLAAFLPKFLGFTGIAIAEVFAWLSADLLLIPSYYRTIHRLENKSYSELQQIEI
ncbi:MAG: MATE family efflux transporter [Xylanivirga thermophila]|uniref:MATE family efflux transporter n=1 Tax=Xylanivirga thermophila TaxID=2496273 RepID=UPI0039F48B8A